MVYSDWDKNGVGKVFDHYGRVPESVYQPHIQLEPLEQAVVNNDTETFHRLVQVRMRHNSLFDLTK